MNNIQFNRPIVFFDLETTGLNRSSDRIVEFTFLKINPDGSEELKGDRVNPEIPIPKEASDIHGINNEDVANKPRFSDYAETIRDFLNGCDLGGFGIRDFDLAILQAEFRRAGLEFTIKGRNIIDTLVIFHKLDPRDLPAAYTKYCGKNVENSHTSEIDVRAAAEILDGQLAMHRELPREIDKLHDICNPKESNWIDCNGKFIWSEGDAIFNFGKYRGKSLREIATENPGYLQWIVGVGDFSIEVKDIALQALDDEFPELPENL